MRATPTRLQTLIFPCFMVNLVVCCMLPVCTGSACFKRDKVGSHTVLRG